MRGVTAESDDGGPGAYPRQVSISLGGRTLLALTHRVAPGEVLTVMGPSGSGKSTLLAYIGGFLDRAFEASGTVTVGAVELTALPAEDRHAGILFQDPLLFPHMSVGGNLLFAIPQIVKGRAARQAMAEAALDGVGLAGMAERDPDTLSGGQKARVALGPRVAVGAAHALARRTVFEARRGAAPADARTGLRQGPWQRPAGAARHA